MKKINTGKSTRSFFVIGFQGKKIPKRKSVYERYIFNVGADKDIL